MAADRAIRIVYADDNATYRTRLVRSLLAEPQIEVVALAVDGPAALDAIRTHHPDVALVDVRAPGMSGLDIAETVTSEALATRILLLAELPVDSTRRVLQAVGVRGVVDRDSSRGEICAAVAAAAG